MMWRTARIVAANELKRIGRHPEILIFGLILPVIIITLIGLTFGTNAEIEIGLLDEDRSPRSEALVQRLEDDEGIVVKAYDTPRELRKDVRTTAVQAGLVIPEGYGEAVDAGRAQVDVVLEPGTEGVASALSAIDSVVTQEGVEQGAIRFVAERLGGGSAGVAEARALVGDRLEELQPVVVEDLDPDTEEEESSFSYTAPANLVLFVFVNTFAVSTAIAIDRKGGQIRRMLGTPSPPGGVLLGLGLSRLLFALVQSSLIVIIGALAFGVTWGDPASVVTLIAVWGLLATSVGVLIGSIVADADQAQAVGIPLAIGFGMLGGCMWPLQIVPDAVRLVGHLTPHAWVMDAWLEVMYDEAGLGAIAPNLAVLGGATLVLGLLATRALRRSLLH